MPISVLRVYDDLSLPLPTKYGDPQPQVSTTISNPLLKGNKKVNFTYSRRGFLQFSIEVLVEIECRIDVLQAVRQFLSQQLDF